MVRDVHACCSLIAIMGGSFEDMSENAEPEILKEKYAIHVHHPHSQISKAHLTLA
jgi:hypothetical protein